MSNQPSPAITRFANFAATAEFQPSAETRTIMRDAFIDTLGCILAGSLEPVCVKLRAAYAETPGAALVIGADMTAEPGRAALINATAAHAIEFDDWEIPGNTHPSSVLFPALLAASAQSSFSGAALIDAYVVGFELIARIGEGANYDHYESGWHATATLGAIGAAAAVARLWRLNATEMAAAISISISRAVGYTCQIGSEAKPLQAGFAAEAGIVSAHLARAGISGRTHALDGPTGFNALMSHGDPARFEAGFASFDQPLALARHGLVMKPYPSCGYTHRLIDCALAMREQRHVPVDQIRCVTLELPASHGAILSYRAPNNVEEARFCLPFCVSLAYLAGAVAAADFAPARWREADIAALMNRIKIALTAARRPELNYDPKQPDRMILETIAGERFETSIAYPLGAPQRPMRSKDVLEKFLGNVGSRLSEGALARLQAWPEANDMRPILNEWASPV